ncbi:MAG TPA: prepilin-type N-terminal cleavage/methylation domain-containing protein [Gemmatimonadales bacterium]|nr:prepilin-type N-terminal cleavage/methylation domain-containing protein [Gemmatimonadales bacterium]
MSLRSGRGSPGFTLLEVMVATVLTGLVAMLAFAAARVTAESAAFIERDLTALRGERAARQMLLDLLHNVRPPRIRGDTGFALAGDRLTFTAAGAPPLDPEYDWLVDMRPGNDGLAISARSLGRGPVSHAELRLPHVTGWQVRVLAPRATNWRDAWVPSPVLPAAVAITLWSGERPFGPPLTVRLSDAGSAPAPPDGSLE